jgi:hypothetical protein
MRRPSLPLLLLLLPAFAQAAHWSEPEIAGLVTDPALAEISGIAASRAHPGAYWAINDGGNGARLHLMDGGGTFRASVDVAGVQNQDWEDLSSFELDGRHYLLVADTGDNGGIRQELRLHAIEEPRAFDAPVAVAWTVRFAWPDGPRDCEAIAVDARRGDVLLLSKKRVPPELFRVPLQPAADGAAAVAEPVGTLAGIEQPDAGDLEKSPTYGRYRSQITGAALSPNGRVLAVLNYRSVHFVVRAPRRSWADALAVPAPALAMPWIPQAEAIAFAPDGRSLLIGSEQLPSPLLRYRVEGGPRPAGPASSGPTDPPVAR